MPHVEIKRPYERRAAYPHMGLADATIWNRFIHRYPDRFIHVWYDFRVGDKDEVAPEHSAIARACWWDLTYWRIDVVAEDAEKIYVIEVKPSANAKALGQASSYAMLYEEDEKPGKPVIAVVLTDILIPTTKRIGEKSGIEIWVV